MSRRHWVLIGTIFALSGALGLIYQVLWMKELRLLFGNTAQATATTLTAFFLGLAVGSWVGGRLAPRLANPLFGYGVAELGIAASALLYFGLVDVYATVFPPIYRALGSAPAAFLLAKFLLGVLLLLPASSFMGATLPLLGQHMVRARGEMGRSGTLLYALNTAGAVLGAYLAGFHLPLVLGFHRTYALGIAASTLLGLIVVGVSGRVLPAKAGEETVTPDETLPLLSWTRIRGLAFLTGSVTLALEVLWTHMFSQVLHNSVYTFATILITFLTALALGAALAHGLIRRRVNAALAVSGLLASGSIFVAVSPNLFNALTGGLRYVAEDQDFASYQFRTLVLALAVIFPPTLLLGSVFPYLLKLSEAHTRSVGRTIGNLVAVNTLGAILGSLAAGFLLLETVGLWSSIRLLAAAGLVGVLLPAAAVRGHKLLRWSPAAALLCLIPTLGVGTPPSVRVNPETEKVLGVWEGSSGVTAVVQDKDGIRIKVNNHYALGGSSSEEVERRQGMLPLLLHSFPERVFFLGMGTGITASAAMSVPIQRVTICELVPDAVTAAREHFGPYTRGLFQDPRTRILVEDGRTYLLAAREQFDVIVADLFVPWQAGEGTLYSREHFEAIRARLRPGGLFAQWVPLYQMSRREFEIVARTMLAVFPEVTLWRADFSPTNPVFALIGTPEARSLDPQILLGRLQEVGDPGLLIRPPLLGPLLTVTPFLLAYCGNLSQAPGLLGAGPVCTDDRPLIEYLAPVTQRRVGSKKASWFTGLELVTFLEELEARVPPAKDPYLANMSPRLQGYPHAGLLVFRGRALKQAGKTEEAEAARQELDAYLNRIEALD